MFEEKGGIYILKESGHPVSPQRVRSRVNRTWARPRAQYANHARTVVEREERRGKEGKKKRITRHEERSSVRTRGKPVGNRASRNADADKGNPYDRLRYGYLWAVLLVRWKNGKERRRIRRWKLLAPGSENSSPREEFPPFFAPGDPGASGPWRQVERGRCG